MLFMKTNDNWDRSRYSALGSLAPSAHRAKKGKEGELALWFCNICNHPRVFPAYLLCLVFCAYGNPQTR